MARVTKILVLVVALALSTAALGVYGAADSLSFDHAQVVGKSGCVSCGETNSHDEAVCAAGCISPHIYITGSTANLTVNRTNSERLLPPYLVALASWTVPIDQRPPRS